MKNNKDYESMVDALNDLKSKGYTKDFNLEEDGIGCKTEKLRIHPEDFQVDEFYRFEGMTNPSDSSVVYAISSTKHNVKGILVDAYGMYSTSVNRAMANKLRFKL